MKSFILRPLLIVIGLLSTATGIVGIFLPLLPTVPLLLLAAACFARSSKRLHRCLLSHPTLGPLIQSYLEGRGIPLKSKITAIVMLWGSIIASVVFFIPFLFAKISVLIIAICVTLYLLRLPTLRVER